MKKVILFVLLLNLISCKKNSTVNSIVNAISKTETKQANPEIIVLENELLSVKKEHKIRLEYYEQATQKEKSHYIYKHRVSAYLKNGKYFFDYKKIINAIYNKLELDKVDFLTSLYFNYNIFHSEYYSQDKETSFLNYIWTNFDRSPENIYNFFNNESESETIKDKIYSLFSNNAIYTDSGIKNYVEGLLLAYEENSSEDRLSEIYNQTKGDEYYEKPFIDTITSEQMKMFLSNATKPTDNSISYRAFQLYSFWGRRYHENNQEIVYQLIKEFHQNMEKENTNTYD